MPAVVPAKQAEVQLGSVCDSLGRFAGLWALLVVFVIGAVIFLLVAPVLAAFRFDSLTGVEQASCGSPKQSPEGMR